MVVAPAPAVAPPPPATRQGESEVEPPLAPRPPETEEQEAPPLAAAELQAQPEEERERPTLEFRLAPPASHAERAPQLTAQVTPAPQFETPGRDHAAPVPRFDVGPALPSHRPLAAELLPQVQRALVSLQRLGGRELNVRLDPPELGALRVTVQRHEGVLNATIQVAHAEVRDTLHQHTEDLKSALAARGLQIAECHVELGASPEQERRLWWDRPAAPTSNRWPTPDPAPWVRPLVGPLALLTPRLNPSLGLNYVA